MTMKNVKKLLSLCAYLPIIAILSSCGNGSVGAAITTDAKVETSNKKSADESAKAKTETETETKPETASEEETSATEGTDEIEALFQASLKDNPPLRDCVSEKLGCRVGCAVTQSEINDPKVFDILTTHFNAVTFGNELKPDALFDYSCTICPGTYEDELNGEKIIVPKLTYGRAESMLNKILNWNKEHPDREIKVRGHVLVWHSQTPEWFFHEDYKKKNDYVSKEEMDRRLEWYIKTVLEHFTGPDSEYKDLFYGWDVVNEAISDSTGGIRTDAENPSEPLSQDRHGSNSSWYHIYQSDEFIINAFKYANKYAPAELELYYNDYNETNLVKRNGIVDLLKAIKDAEGEPGVGTRISGMGMQAHYGIDTPAYTDLEYSAKLYGQIVGNVQLTELDIKAGSDYDGSPEAKEAFNDKLKKRYGTLYFGLQSAANSGECNVTGITFWGTVDHYSWLQTSSSVGGGSTTGLPQSPLLFDENYLPKPCFYVFTQK